MITFRLKKLTRYNRNNARPRLANKRSKLSNNPPSDVSEYGKQTP